MKELLRTADPVRISFVEATLAAADIDCLVLDANIGALSIGAIPPRLMVADEDFDAARRVLREAGESLE